MGALKSRRSYVIGVLLVITLAVLLRVVFVHGGLPFRYQVDENNRMDTIEGMLSERSLNPHWFGHPAQTVIYPVAALVTSAYFAGRLVGVFDSPSDFADWYHNDPSFIYMLVRSFMLLVSVAVILVLMALTRKLYSNRAALVAGAVLALAPLHIYYSPLIRSSDIILSLFLLLCTFPILDIFQQKQSAKQQKDSSPTIFYALAGIFLGLSVASKYYGVFAAVGILTAHVMVFGFTPSKYKYLFIAGGFSLLSAFIAGPYLFLDFMQVLRSVTGEARASHLSATAPGFFEDIWWFGSVAGGQQGTGPVFILLALLGIVLSFRANWRKTAVVLAAPLAILVFLASLKLRWPRWTLVFLPFLAIFAGFALDYILVQIEKRLPSMRKKLVPLFIVLGVFSWSLVSATKLVIERQKTDVRDLAYEWINQHVPAGSRFYVEMYGPQLDRNKYSILSVKADNATFIDRNTGGFVHYEPRNVLADVESLDTVLDSGIEYVVLSDFEDRFRRSRFVGQYKDTLGKYEELRKRTTLLLDTSVAFKDSRGKRVQIYKLADVGDGHNNTK